MRKLDKKSWLAVIVIIITGSIFYFLNRETSREAIFVALAISYPEEISCTMEETGGIYNKNNSIQPENVVEIQDSHRDNNPIRFTFKFKEEDMVKILIADSGGVSEVDGLVITRTPEKIHIINTWGTNNNNIQQFSIYLQNGFFTWTRSGDMLLIGQNLGYGYGRCI